MTLDRVKRDMARALLCQRALSTSTARYATQPADRLLGLAGDLLPACASVRNAVKEEWRTDLQPDFQGLGQRDSGCRPPWRR